MKPIFGSVIFLIMGVCFFRVSYHAVLLGRPVVNIRLKDGEKSDKYLKY